MKKIIFISLLIINLNNCSNSVIDNGYKLNTKRPAFYERDSIFINFSLNQWYINKDDFPDYDDWYFHNFKTNQNISFIVDSILYSPDSLKFFAFIIVKFNGKSIDEDYLPQENKYYNKFPEKTFFDGFPVIGFRDTYKNIWKTYFFHQAILHSKNEINGVKNGLRNFYFKQFKDEGELILGDFKKYNYNINDTDFWDKSILTVRSL